MHSETSRLLDLATAPLENNAELELAAKTFLQREFATNHANPDAIRETADALARADRHPRRNFWKIALYVTALLVSLVILAPSVWKLRALARVSDIISPFSMGMPEEPDTTGYTPREKLLLYGDTDAPDNSGRWKPLWDSEPENPAFLAQYAAAYLSDHKTLSPEILEAAARIDPDNGWFLAMAAGGPVESAVIAEKQSSKEQKEFKTKVWTIRDRTQLDASLTLIRQAMEKPRFKSYELELMQQRVPLLPERHDWISQIPPIAYAASQTTSVIHLRRLMDAMAAEAQECAARKDVEGFQQLVGDWQRLAKRSTENGFTLVELLVAKVIYLGPAGNFRDAAQALGLDEQAAYFDRIHEQRKADKEFRNTSKRDSPQDQLAERKGSILTSLTLPMVARQVKSPPPLAAADLTPGRYADHALLARAVTVPAWLLLGVCAGLAALHRFRQAPMFRLLSIRMTDLLRASDWIMILAGGILVPVLWYLAITRLTPLSAREWSMRSSAFIQPVSQYGSMLLMMIILPPVIAAWRLGRRDKVFGLGTRFQWLGWLACAAAALATLTSGAMMLRPGNLLFYLTFALLGLAVLWPIVGFLRNLFGKHPHALRRSTIARAVIPAWIFGMLVLAVSIPFHHADERKWIQRDRHVRNHRRSPRHVALRMGRHPGPPRRDP